MRNLTLWWLAATLVAWGALGVRILLRELWLYRNWVDVRISVNDDGSAVATCESRRHPDKAPAIFAGPSADAVTQEVATHLRAVHQAQTAFSFKQPYDQERDP